MSPSKAIAAVAWALAAPILLLAGWVSAFVVFGATNPYLTDPRAVMVTILAHKSELAANALLSLMRVATGVLIGTLVGVTLGVLVARQSWLRRLLAPTLNALTAVPVIVLIPFFLVAFGAEESFRIAVVAAVVTLLVYQAMFKATKDFPAPLEDLAAHREKSEFEIARQMLLPNALPEIVHGVRLSLLFAWLAVALAEKAVAEWPEGGLGFQILRAREMGRYDEMFAAVIVLGAMALLIDRGVAMLEHLVSHWRPSTKAGR